MQAVVVTKASGSPELKSGIPIPVPGPGEALVKVIRAGICATDLEIIKGYAGFEGIVGHEFIGKVEKVNPESEAGAWIGKRVAGEINVFCNVCDICKSDDYIRKRNHCPDRTVMGIVNKNGTYAEYLTLPLQNLLEIPENVTDLQACFVEPLAAACRILEQGLVSTGYKVAIVGDGKLGLLIAEVMAQQDCHVTIFGRHWDKMNLCPEKITKVLSDGSEELINKYRDCFDVVVEVTGNMGGLMLTSEITRPLGTVVLKTTCASGGTEFNTSPFVVKEIKLIGSRCGPFANAIKYLKDGKIHVDKLITKVYPFKEAITAIEHAGKKGTLKIQLKME
ncbi:2-deoxy-scyllo-inosamine dehydrogenase-like [Mytilus edulis]|uniref:2-deoxy-scyllo-inosamine dehydrogenase-like n=1 Tax=Mytilus edulis TaxID=6550 RepID=UPI0039EF7A27